MKAVIVELRGKKAAALDETGCVSIIPNRNYSIGQTVLLKKKLSGRKFFTRIAASAAAAMLCIGIISYALPYSKVSLDVNPSFSYTVNIYDRVIGMKAMDTEADSTVSALKGKVFGKTIEEVVTLTLDSLRNENFLASGSDAEVVLTVSGNASRSEKLAGALKTAAEEAVAPSGTADTENRIRISSVAVSGEFAKEAAEKNITPGKLYLMQSEQETSGQPAETVQNENPPETAPVRETVMTETFPAAKPESRPHVPPEKPSEISTEKSTEKPAGSVNASENAVKETEQKPAASEETAVSSAQNGSAPESQSESITENGSGPAPENSSGAAGSTDTAGSLSETGIPENGSGNQQSIPGSAAPVPSERP